jgi:benzoylformate decarboxylase
VLLKAAEAFVETLRAWDVRYLFGLPGSTEAPLLDALQGQDDIQYVLGLHETVLVAMADGYARVSGRPAVVGLHTTMGSLNGWSMVYNAYRDGSPVVLTAGHKETGVLARDGFSATPELAGLFRDCTKWSWQSLRGEQVAGDLYRALHVASVPRQGPTFLALPEDVLAEEVDGPHLDPGGAFRAHLAGRPDPDALAAAAELLAAAELPLLVAGSEVHKEGAVADAVALAERVGMAVVCEHGTSFSRSAFPSDHPQFFGDYGQERALVEEADVVLAVGCRMFVEFSAKRAPRLPSAARLIHVYPEPSQVGWQHPPEVGIVGSARAALRDLAEVFAARGDDSAALDERQSQVLALGRWRRERLKAVADAEWDQQPASLARVARDVRRVLPPETVLMDEAVRSSPKFREHFTVPAEGQLHRGAGGSLGWGVPAALGAQLALPDRPVVAVVGEGSLHFTIQSLWTAAQLDLPVVVVVLDNASYLAVQRAVELYLGEKREDWFPGTLLPDLDHVAVARGYGIDAERVDDPAGIPDVVDKAVRAKKPYLIDIPVEAVRP